jgi:hypothetical protein
MFHIAINQHYEDEVKVAKLAGAKTRLDTHNFERRSLQCYSDKHRKTGRSQLIDCRY